MTSSLNAAEALAATASNEQIEHDLVTDAGTAFLSRNIGHGMYAGLRATVDTDDDGLDPVTTYAVWIGQETPDEHGGDIDKMVLITMDQDTALDAWKNATA